MANLIEIFSILTIIGIKFKTTPILKGTTYGIIAMSMFYVHVVLGIFSMLTIAALYEHLENTQKKETGRNYFYLTVFVIGAILFGIYVVSNINKLN